MIYFESTHGGATSFQWVQNPKPVTMATGSACSLCLEQKTSIWCVKIMDLTIITTHIRIERFHYLNKNIILNLMLRPLKLRTLINELLSMWPISSIYRPQLVNTGAPSLNCLHQEHVNTMWSNTSVYCVCTHGKMVIKSFHRKRTLPLFTSYVKKW